MIPGYENLRTFSEARESLLKETCGGQMQSYVQRGHWRMILPFARNGQEEEAEALLVAGEPDLGVDLVKVPHHGSRTSSSAALVAATRPQWAVISCGRANRFGFPADEVVRRWEAVGARVLQTALHGSVSVRITPAGDVTIRTY